MHIMSYVALCVYICVCVCVCIYIYIYIYTCSYKSIYIHMHNKHLVHMCIYVCACEFLSSFCMAFPSLLSERKTAHHSSCITLCMCTYAYDSDIHTCIKRPKTSKQKVHRRAKQHAIDLNSHDTQTRIKRALPKPVA
jgi:hypothetical protein